jgi:uncharacterized protein (TIRG00374 family)
MKGGGKALKIVVSLAISAFFIWLTLRGTELQQVWVALKSANYLYVIPYLGILAAIHFCRVYRWGILLEPVGRPSFRKLNSAGAIGFMALMIIPFRLGEFARPLLVAEKGKLRRSAAMASVVVERVVDGIAMAVVLIAAMLFSRPVTRDEAIIGWVRAGGVMVFCAFAALLVFLLIAYWQRDLAVRIVDRLTRPISARLAAKLSGMLDAFIGGLKVVPDRRKVLLFFALTAIYWGINGGGMALLARGFGLHVPPAGIFAVLGVLVVGVMIPSGPGMLGTFQGAVILGMQLFFPDPAYQGSIQAYAWVLWAVQTVQQLAFGLYFLVLGHVSIGSLWQTAPQEEDEEGEPAQQALGQVQGK